MKFLSSNDVGYNYLCALVDLIKSLPGPSKNSILTRELKKHNKLKRHSSGLVHSLITGGADKLSRWDSLNIGSKFKKLVPLKDRSDIGRNIESDKVIYIHSII